MSNAYIPLKMLKSIHIESMLSVALPLLLDDHYRFRYDYHQSRRTMLKYLLSIKSYDDKDSVEYREFIKVAVSYSKKFNWEDIEKTARELESMPEPYKQQYRVDGTESYWELQRLTRPGPKQALEYINKYRSDGFGLDELKIYWNYEEILGITNDQFNSECDQDSHDNLKKWPVKKRSNAGGIKYIQSGIEKAVSDVPEGMQIIVLDFADERMPGGYFLENARTQEEVILYNSDGYRAILDLKYKKMFGGYMIPEYGVAYIKNVRFFQNSESMPIEADLIVGACYDLSHAGEGLYRPPSRGNTNELEQRTYQKFQAIIASAVANTEGNGEKTYLLLGPIGTGAFANDIQMIARLFARVLNGGLMGCDTPIRKAFKEIWFVSTDSLARFKESFEHS